MLKSLSLTGSYCHCFHGQHLTDLFVLLWIVVFELSILKQNGGLSPLHEHYKLIHQHLSTLQHLVSSAYHS